VRSERGVLRAILQRRAVEREMEASGLPEPRGDTDGRGFLPLLAALVLALAVSVHDLGAKSFWLDEAFSVALARHDWPDLWRTIVTDQANMGLYYVLLHVWLGLGTSEEAVRSLSALFAVATVVPVYALGRRLFGREAALTASVLLAVNAYFVRYAAQEARGYGLALFLTAAASYLFVKALDAPSVARWTAYVLTGALSVYAHFFGALVIAAHFVAAMLPPARGRASRRSVIVSQGIVAVLAVPLLLPVLTVTHLGWLARPSWRTLVNFSLEFTGYGGRALVLVYGALCCCALVAALRSRAAGAHTSYAWGVSFVLTWLLLPILTTVLFSLIAKPIFHPRYLIITLPALALLTAAGVTSLRSPWLRTASLLLVVALSARGLAAWYGEEIPKENWRDVTRYVVSDALPGDEIVFDAPYVRIPFEYYLHELRAERRGPAPAFPTQPWGAFPVMTPEFAMDARDWLERHPRPIHSRLWLISRHDRHVGRRDAAAQRSSNGVQRDRCAARTRDFEGGIRVQLLAARGCSNGE
jgi:mannosyltransferase